MPSAHIKEIVIYISDIEMNQLSSNNDQLTNIPIDCYHHYSDFLTIDASLREDFGGGNANGKMIIASTDAICIKKYH